MTISELPGIALAVFPRYALWHWVAIAVVFTQFPVYLFGVAFATCVTRYAFLWRKGRVQFCLMLALSFVLSSQSFSHALSHCEVILTAALRDPNAALGVSVLVSGVTLALAIILTANSNESEKSAARRR